MNRLFFTIFVSLFIPASLFAAKDRAEYTVKVIVLEQQWTSHNLRVEEYKGTGRGNVWEGDTVRAFDFRYECGFGLKRTVRNQPYPGKWKKPGTRLAILSEKIGSEGKYQECELQTTLHDGVYMTGNGGLTEMAQADFKAWRARRGSPRSEPAPASVAKLSVASTPEGADVEVDGEFVGNTPSVLQLDPGAHRVSMTKPGYKSWEKKITLAPGDIKLTADLQPEGN